MIDLPATAIKPIQQLCYVERLVEYLAADILCSLKIAVVPVGRHQGAKFYFTPVVKAFSYELQSGFDRHVDIRENYVGAGVIGQTSVVG